MVNRQCTDKTLNFRLTPEYDKTPEESVVEWLEKMEVIPPRHLRGIPAAISCGEDECGKGERGFAVCLHGRLVHGDDQKFVTRKLSANEPVDQG
ncbi:hypothetical protein T4B_11842 [Trichinella pseudospiralis]|uniref:Uncharacterized protein n=2 Tax=Trichinella pseudospiralis TaxID=6337 RepID=A0A0V1F8G4_TRIPS|nr:hypothetical protein T4D_14004 [Trichinella pseudospiralis]KRZ19598.1 hypothetical protein T4B_11842 [Trichinella pseudospiralis]KRZ36580.1 hypothetical protein T4C_313 [Trichinella pseudospiralis]